MVEPDQEHFPDLEQWPEAHPPMGHNQPPLEAAVVLQFDEAIAVKGLRRRISEISQAAARAPDIVDQETAGAVGDLIAEAKAATKAVDAEREIINRPLLDAQRGLKSKADGLLATMEGSIGELREKLNAYIAEHQDVAHGEMGSRVSARETWEFEIVDFAKLPLTIRRHPTVKEAIEKVIRGLIKAGERKIAGVKIWASKKATVR